MGRLNPQTPATAPEPATVTHFTHPHELHPVSVNNPQVHCSGCRLPSHSAMYACLPCNFTLHHSCALLPRHITHPSHLGCTLILTPSSSYTGAAFTCDGCTRQGEGWSYHCPRCNYDLHVTCASKPMKIRHQSHASCLLDLTFKSPYDGAGFSCDVCRRIGSKQTWLYRCNSCEFDAHLECVAGVGTPNQGVQQQLQHSHSLPAPAPIYQNQQLVHSASTPGMYGYGQYPIQNPGPAIQPGGNAGGGLGANLMRAAMEGVVEGAFQQMTQIAVQNVLVGDAGGDGAVDVSGGGDGGGGGDSSTY